MLNNTSLKKFKHKISFAAALIVFGIIFSTTSFSQTTQCSIGTPTNLVSSPPQTAFLSNNNTDTYIDIPLIANPTLYTRSGNNIIVNMQWAWSNGFPTINSGASTMEIVVNDVVYARLVTTNDAATNGTFTAQNSAFINTANSATAIWGTSTIITGTDPFASRILFNGSVQLPSTVTQISKVQVHYVAPNNGSADDFEYRINNVSACAAPNLSVVKTSNGPWLVGQSGANYTLTATNSGSASTTGTTTIQDTLPTGITPNWSGTRTVTNSGITWACTFSGQNVTCTTSNSLSNTGTNTSQITLPVNVTNSAAIGTNTNYASIGGGGDPYNSGTIPTPGASCSDATHCASNQTTVTASSDLTISKTHTGNFTVGGFGNYRFSVSNSGTSTATLPITVSDTLPTGMVVNGGNAGTVALSGTNAASWSCNSNSSTPQTISCSSSATIGAGSSSIFNFDVYVGIITPTGTNSVTNTATVTGTNDVNTSNNSASDPTTIVPDVSLPTSKTVCSAGTAVNLVSGAPILYSRSEDLAIITNSVPLIANASNYVRSGNNIVVQTSWKWSNGSPAGSTTLATQELKVNGVTYARLTTTNGASTTGTFQLLNGATGSTANITGDTGSFVARDITLPLSVTSISSIDFFYVGGGTPSDDISVNIIDASACSTSLAVTKSSNGPWTVGQSNAQYTLTATNSGATSTFGTTTVRDTLPTGITPNWTGTNTVVSNGISWACTFSGQNVTCTTSNNIPNSASTSQITLPVNVTSSAASGINTNYASIGGGGDPNNGGTPPTPGASCSDATHCASNSTTVSFPDLTISKSHSGSFVRGSTGTYNLTVSNSGAVDSSGTITVTDTLPIGLRVNGGTAGAVAIGGTNAANWTCNSAAAANNATQTVTCTSPTAIAASSSSIFTLTVQVTAAAATGTLTNNAAVSGGGESNVTNNTASDPTTIVAGSNVTFSNYQCGSNANLRTLVNWSNAAIPTAFSSGSYSFTDPSSGATVTVTSTATSIKRTSDASIPSPFGTQYLEIVNNSPTVTITLSQAVRIQTILGDLDNTESPTIVGYNGATAVLPQIVPRSAFSPLVTNQGTNMLITATGISTTNVGDFEPSVSADVIFNSPVDKIVIFNSGGIGGGTIDLMNFVSCAPSLSVSKVTTGGTGSFTFNSTASNGFGTTNLTTTAVNTPVSSGYSYLTAGNTVTTVTETIPGGWNLASAVCVDGNNNAVTSSLAGNVLTLPANSVKLDAQISCTFTNAVITPPNVSLLKSCPNPSNCTTALQPPGTDLTYDIQFTNTGGQGATNIIVVDKIPDNTDFKIGSATVNAGTTGLTTVIEYSSNYDPLNPLAATWTYTPVSSGGGAPIGYDRNVKAVRWRVTAGTLSNVSPNNTGTVSFLTKIR